MTSGVLHWDCKKNGCFNQKKRLKFKILDENLPGKIGFSDIDAITEVNGHFLILEWKPCIGDLPLGQKIMFERMTKGKRFTVFVVAGDAEGMNVESICTIFDGKIKAWAKSTIEVLQKRISNWSAWAKSN